MSKDFVPHQEALELKELGFDEPCFGYYEPNGELDYIENHILKDFPYLAKNSEWKDLVAAPTFSQAFRWFREKYQLHSYIEGAYPWFRFYINSEDNRWEGHKHLSHEDAELACLKKLIQIVKENKQ
jgi:hypothetical protein